MNTRLKDMAVVLTGGSRGIGRETAIRLAKEGARLAIISRDETRLAKTAADVRQQGAEVFSIPGDVTDDDSIRKAVDLAANGLGGIDVFMNIAGITLEKKLEAASPDDYTRIMNTNLLGAVRSTINALPHLKKSRGILVNVASLIVRSPFPYLGVYACSKWALAGYSHTLRQELHGTGVRVLIVYPTVVRTDMVDEAPVLAKAPSQSAKKCANAIVKAIKKGKLEVHTSLFQRFPEIIFSLYPPWNDRINRLFLPSEYK
ncbi:MAG: SDR family NAD(P)-dependent oxidoreductase [Proteobacteria bacterium]|nr:SDR family NAD(P)-dependent oxidoreductase [Pseudomonadota bacterium]